MKVMYKYFSLIAVALLLIVSSCQTRAVGTEKPMHDNTLELYKKYSIQTMDAKVVKMEVLKVDSEKIYGKLKTGEQTEILRSEVREIKQTDYFMSALIGVVAILAVVFIPI